LLTDLDSRKEREKTAAREMTGIALGLVYFGLCLGKFARAPSRGRMSAVSCTCRVHGTHNIQHRLSRPPQRMKSVWLHYHDLWRPKSPLNVLHASLQFFTLLAATIKSQFIEIPHESIHVGDDAVLKCWLADEDQESRDDANYVWYLNSESREMKKLLSIFSPFATNTRRDFVSFFPFFRSSSCCSRLTMLSR
jgi:hypothetical protein